MKLDQFMALLFIGVLIGLCTLAYLLGYYHGYTQAYQQSTTALSTNFPSRDGDISKP